MARLVIHETERSEMVDFTVFISVESLVTYK